MKKILLIAHSLMDGGVEHFILDLCKNIDPNEFQVSLLILCDNHLELVNEIPAHVRYEIIKNQYTTRGLRDTLSLLLSVKQITYAINRFSPDVIHTNTFQTNLTPILLAIAFARRSRPIKHVHTIHTAGLHYDSKTIRSRIKLKYELLWYRIMKTNIVCLTKYLKNKINKDNTLQTRVIYNGVDLNRFQNHNQVKEDLIQTLVYTARFDIGKSHDTLIDALSILSTKHQNFRLVLIGDGPLRKSIEEKVSKLKLQNFVVYMGNVKRDKIPELLAKSDIGIFPSEFEGFSIALVEMMAAGLPIVCTDIPVFREVFEDYPNMKYFPSRNHIVLAERINELLESDSLRSQMSKKSIEIAKRFSHQRFIAEYEKLYDECVLNK